jgi:uncharacterized integral membrane protein
MRFLKVIFATILCILAIVFIIENQTTLSQTITLKFDIYLHNFETAAVPLWVIVLFSFFLGVFTAALYGIYEILVQRQTIRRQRQNLEILGQELKKASATAELAATPTAEATVPPREE